MKRLLCILIAAAAAFMVTACGSAAPEADGDTVQTAETEYGFQVVTEVISEEVTADDGTVLLNGSYELPRLTLTATLDGELTDENGRQGILEIKTGQLMKKADYDKWADGNVPVYYLTQTCWQLLATGWDFVDLFAALQDIRGDWSIRTRRIERSDHEEDLAWLLDKAETFWDYVQKRQMPPMTLSL